MNPKSPAFKRLKAEWYKKLKDSGFEDIEDSKSGLLHKWHGKLFAQTYDSVVTPAKQEYYRRAAQELHSYPFKSDLERLIWEKHSEGYAIRSIVTFLRKEKRLRSKTSRNTVHSILKHLAKDMGLAWKKL